MLVYLADGSQAVSNSIFHVSLIVCDTGARDLSAVVEFCIFSSLFHDIAGI